MCNRNCEREDSRVKIMTPGTEKFAALMDNLSQGRHCRTLGSITQKFS